MNLCCRRVPGNAHEIPPANVPHKWNKQKIQATWITGCAFAGGFIGRLTVLLYDSYIRDYFKIPHAPIEPDQAQINGSVVGGILGGHIGKWLANQIHEQNHLE